MRASSPGTHGTARPGGRGDPGDPVLASKVTMPELPEWAVTRPRIDKLLAEGAQGPLTSVTGPPGAGKTMAVAAWAATASYPCALAWVSLDDFDNRPRVFWSYVVAALRRAGIAVPRVVPGPGRVSVDHAFLVRLASALAAQDPPVVLVLDDLHLLTEPVILEGLGYVLRNAGPGLHLIVASRADPLLPLHRYRLAGQLTEIRADDLAFSVRESALLLTHHGVTLSVPALERITARTEGWAAGMRLAALSLQGRPDPEQFAKELETGDSALTGYLVDEVLNVQAPSVRDMLLRTSILDSVSTSLAAELTGDQAGADALPALARADAFVRPLGQGWYRYHSLLAAVLRLKLRVECGAQVPDLYRRAARWSQQHGRLGDAVRYAAQSGDWPFTAGIVVDEFAIGQLIDLRGHQPLAEALRGMPRDTAWTQPQPQPLLVTAAVALSRGAYEAAAAPLAAAEGLLGPPGALRDHGDHGDRAAGDQIAARLAAALIRLALGRRTGDFEMAAAASRHAEDLMAELPEEVRAQHPEIRAQVMAGCGVVEAWAGRLDAAAVRFAGAAASAARETAHERADCLGYLALVEALRGRLSRAAERAGQAADAMSHGGGDLAEHIIPAANVALAWVCLQQGDTQEAHAQLKLAEAALQSGPDKLVSALACVVAAQRRLAGGQAAPATDMIRRAAQDWSPSPPGWLEAMLIVLESRARAAAGDAPAAVATAQRAGQGPGAAAALAHAWLAAGDEQAARRALTPAGPDSRQLEVALAEARLSYTAGDGTRGRRCLERALRIAKPEQVRLPFVMERAWLRQVLRRDPELAQPYRELLGPCVITPGTVPLTMAPAAPAAPLVVERLSAREREVLTHASGMLSTAEIAAEMFLSVNTVKTHLRSIYRKLSATHRSEAVRRARQLELI
jgi:LuxR family maltose regulon positive regulatory protein